MKQRIAYIYRATVSFFSIENIFRLIAKELSVKFRIDIEEIFLPYAGLNFSSLFRNRKFIKKKRADLFHVTGDVHYISLFLPAKKTVLTIHDCVFMYSSNGIKKWVLKKLLLDWPVAHCAAVTAISEKTKSDVMRFTGCSENKIRVIPDPVSIQVTYIQKQFNTQKPIILFIGTTPNKNLERVIEALGGINCELHIVGNLPEDVKRSLEKSTIDFRNHVNLSETEMIAKYTEADIVLFPSTFEGFGMPIIEGQKSGRVIITSELSPMKEVAGNGACLVDPFNSDAIRNAVVSVVQDREYRETLIKNGFENVKKYEAAAVASAYHDLYNEILEKN